MGMKEMLDKLIADAGMPDNEIAVRELLERMEKIDLEVLKAASDQFKELCEAWLSDVTKSEDKAYICIRLAELSIVDTPEFRECLHAAIRKVLPPYLTSGSVIKAIGAKDSATSVHDAAMRLRKLQQLRSTALVYQQSNHSWGKIHGIDNVTGTIAISSLESGSVSSIPIASAITSVHFFNTTDFDNLCTCTTNVSTHRVQKVCKVNNVWFSCCVLNNCKPFCFDCSKHCVDCRTN